MRGPAQVLTEHPQHVPVQSLNGSRVFADQQVCDVVYRARDAVRIAAVTALSPADESLISFNFDERPGPPAGVTVERLNPTDSHSTKLTTLKCAYVPPIISWGYRGSCAQGLR